jgi:hypothetical protein
LRISMAVADRGAAYEATDDESHFAVDCVATPWLDLYLARLMGCNEMPFNIQVVPLAGRSAAALALCAALGGVSACTPKSATPPGPSAQAPSPAAAAAKLNPTGRWQIDDETSALDADRKVGARLLSTNEVANAIGRADHAELAFACRRKKLLMAVEWPSFLGSGDAAVRWKMDGGEIVPYESNPQEAQFDLAGVDQAAAKVLAACPAA